MSTTAILLWAHDCSAHTLLQDTASLFTHIMLMFLLLMTLWDCWVLSSSSLISIIKPDNGHGLVAHSPWVPPYSTLSLIWKLGIMIFLSINLSALVNTTHVTIKQKDWVLVVYFHHRYTMMHISSYAGLPTYTLPAAHLMHSCSPLLLEASTHFSWI